MDSAHVDGQDQRFRWTRLYQAIADKLLDYRKDRGPLIECIHDIATRAVPMSIFQDRFSDGSTGPLADICPFTTMATFNRGMTDTNRQTVAGELADFLGVQISAPAAFPGIPTVNNQKTWFFDYSEDRDDGDIDTLWNVFAAALQFTDVDARETRAALTEAYDLALEVNGVRWNLSMALYWVRPWDFVPLDDLSRSYISNGLGMHVPTTGRTKPGDGESYLRFLDELKIRLDDSNSPVHSFPELSLAAWNIGRGIEPQQDEEPVDDGTDDTNCVEDERETYPVETYSVTNVLDEGCFLEHDAIERILERLRTRKKPHPSGPAGYRQDVARKTAGVRAHRREKRQQGPCRPVPSESFLRGLRPRLASRR